MLSSSHHDALALLDLESASSVLGLLGDDGNIAVVEVVVDLICIVIALLLLVLLPLLLKVVPQCRILVVGLHLELLVGEVEEDCAGEVVGEADDGLVYGELVVVGEVG